MKAYPERSAAMELLRKYNSEPFHIQHAWTVEGTMRWYAEELGYGEDSIEEMKKTGAIGVRS